jgi:electron transport complex protein RnfA
MNILLFMIGCVFTHNIVFDRLLGVGDAGKDRRVEVAAVYGLAVCAVMTLTAVCAWVVDSLLLTPMKLDFLRVPTFTLIAILISLLGQVCLGKAKPAWLEQLEGCALPVAANVAVLGVALMNAEAGYSFAYALLNGLCSGVGFLLAVVLMAGVREKLEFSRIPAPFKGMPITLISAGLIALAFIGFKGMA